MYVRVMYVLVSQYAPADSQTEVFAVAQSNEAATLDTQSARAKMETSILSICSGRTNLCSCDNVNLLLVRGQVHLVLAYKTIKFTITTPILIIDGGNYNSLYSYQR